MKDSPNKTILHVITSLGDGGAEAALFRLCTHDVHNTHVVVSLLDAGKYGPMLEVAGVRVYCLGMKPGRATPAAIIKLWRIVRSFRPAVVQTWMYHANLLGGLAARLAGVRAVCWGLHHCNLEREHNKRSTLMVAELCGRLSPVIPGRIVVCSEKAACLHGAHGYVSYKMEVVPNGYDLSYFAPAPELRRRVRHELGVSAHTALIGMVARFHPLKDHGNLIHALRCIDRRGHEFVCVLAGSDVDASNTFLVAALKEANLLQKVLLIGRRDDVPAIMNALDLHVLSSAGEAFPNVLAEAMACGTPCVTTDVGDAASIVGPTGWVVPPRDSGILAGAIEAALQERADGAVWGRRQQAARERVAERFDILRMVAGYRTVWRRASEARNGSQ